MVTKSTAARKPLLTAELLKTAAAHGIYGFDLRGFTFGPNHTHTCDERALVRAQAEGLKALHVRGYVWCVPSGSRPGESYTVIANGKTTCDCEAGRAKRLCKHAALVDYTRRQIAESEAAAKVAPVAPITRLEDLFRDEPRAQLSREAW